MATADRVLVILGLFTLEEPVWTVDALAHRLGLSLQHRLRVRSQPLGCGAPGAW